MKYINKVFTTVIIVQQTKNIKNKKQNLNVEKNISLKNFCKVSHFQTLSQKNERLLKQKK